MFQPYQKAVEEESQVSEQIYRKIFHNIQPKIKFFILKKDKCTQCIVYKASSGAQKLELAQSFADYKEREKDSFEAYKADTLAAGKNKSQKVFSYDMQSVLYPKLMIVFYKRKFNAYYFTIYKEVSKNRYCYLWDESHAKRGLHVIPCQMQF